MNSHINPLDKLDARSCPVCGADSQKARPFLERSIDLSRITDASFASRKLPEYMSHRLVRCADCTTIYAAEGPPPEVLAAVYRGASYDTAVEAEMAATTYANLMAPHVSLMAHRGALLEIGTGTGVFLARMEKAGFETRIGVEPSQAAIEAADPAVKPLIREGIFDRRDFAPGSISMICCFQTLEHVPDPRQLVEDAYSLLEPGGLLALITHNADGALNRLLGRRSPIIDIEHLQLFTPDNMRYLLGKAGFQRIDVESLRNTYPLRYWLRLAPLPMKQKILNIADAAGVGALNLSVNVGNIVTTAWKAA
jgi:SAM-dependent methyltransferase